MSGLIQIARMGLDDYELQLERTVRDALREDAQVLRAIEIKPYIPTTAAEADALAQTKGILVVHGFLSLDGENGRVFDFQMEAGLTEAQDTQIAEQLAKTCVRTVREMKKIFKREEMHIRAGLTPKRKKIAEAVHKAVAVL